LSFILMRKLSLVVLLAALAGGALLVASPQQAPASQFYPIDQIKPGQVGIGRTVFSGNTIEEFRANILGVLHNVLGPRRDLILARLEGGPLATTGVISGMSGSPIYIDGRLVGAVSYALGSFPTAPIAGITPIGEMTDAVQGGGPRPANRDLALDWTAPTSAGVFAALTRLAERAMTPLRATTDFGVIGPPALADLAPSLRPIGAAMVFSGFEPSVDASLRQALGSTGTAPQGPRPANPADSGGPLRPGDAVGLSLIRGDLEMGATGTVTYVDGTKVYAFGHPFLNLGPTTLAMTRSHVYTVLPSLDSSLKIASLGPVIGTVSQDRTTAVGGTLGAGPRELDVTVTLSSDRAADRKFTFHVLQDQLLTPLFSYVALLNSLGSYERQAGVLTVAASGTVSFGADGQVTVDDRFTGDNAATLAATAVAQPLGAAANNEFKTVVAERADFHFTISEKMDNVTIERMWLDTTKPHFGATHSLQVLLRDYRGGTETISMPITMPTQASGPLTLLVSDAATLGGLEQRELKPGKASSWPALLAQMNDLRRNNRLYVRLISSSTGTVVGGHTLPGLPGTIRSVLDADASVASAPVSRAVVGAWDRRFDRVVRGSREITITLTARQ
jgi:hypothetical protein